MSVQIEKARRRRLKPFIVELDPLIMKKMKLKKGHFIALIGEKKSAAIVRTGKLNDKGLGIIRIDSRLRRNLGKDVGDTIEIERVKICPAEQLVLIPLATNLYSLMSSDDELRRGLFNLYPITLFDKVYTMSRTKYVVASLIPNEICFVNIHTEITILNESMNGYDDKVIEILSKIIQLDPKDKDVWCSLGDAYMKKMDYEKAEEAYLKTLELIPKNHRIWTSLGCIYNRNGDYDKAIKALQTATNYIPNLPIFPFEKHPEPKSTEFKKIFEIPYYLGYAFRQKGEYTKAINYYNIVLDINPYCKIALNDLGMIHHNKGEFLKAIDTFKNSLNISIEAYLQPYSLYYWSFGYRGGIDDKFKQSSHYFQYKKAFDLGNFNAWLNLAKVYLDIKEYDKALHSCEESLKIDPKSEEALRLHEIILNSQK